MGSLGMQYMFCSFHFFQVALNDYHKPSFFEMFVKFDDNIFLKSHQSKKGNDSSCNQTEIEACNGTCKCPGSVKKTKSRNSEYSNTGKQTYQRSGSHPQHSRRFFKSFIRLNMDVIFYYFCFTQQRNFFHRKMGSV